MKMDAKERREVIEKLATLASDARSLHTRLEELYKSHNLHERAELTPVLDKAYNLVRALRIADATLKQESEGWITDYLTSWHNMRENVETYTTPVYKSVVYGAQGLARDEDQWTVIMWTPTHGTERVIVHSDGYGYCDVYEVEKLS
jgi:hypothetical protein